jgi:hypothetical protein
VPISPLIEDELHPRVQTREYARYLQSTYTELLDKAVPESLAALLDRIGAQSARRRGQAAEESTLAETTPVSVGGTGHRSRQPP